MRPNWKLTSRFSLLLVAASLAVAQPPMKKVVAYKISGNAAPGAMVALYGPATGRSTSVPNSKPVTSAYQFTGVAPGTYTVKPSKPSCVFEPLQKTVTVTNGDVSGVDFTLNCIPPGGPGGPGGRGGDDPSGRGRGRG
jgi:hypothetical protein